MSGEPNLYTDTDIDEILIGRDAEMEIARRRIAELEAALKPFADAVYRDNGDVTIIHVEQGHYLRAKRLIEKP